MKIVAMTERLIDAAVDYERATGIYSGPARKELSDARAVIEAIMTWQDMSIAPKDGTRLMLYQAGRGAFEGWYHYSNCLTDDEAYWTDDQDSEPSPIAWMPLLPGPNEK